MTKKQELYHEIGHTACIALSLVDEYICDNSLKDKQLDKYAAKVITLLYKIYDESITKASKK